MTQNSVAIWPQNFYSLLPVASVGFRHVTFFFFKDRIRLDVEYWVLGRLYQAAQVTSHADVSELEYRRNLPSINPLSSLHLKRADCLDRYIYSQKFGKKTYGSRT